jgi:hypothetical protein
MTEQQPEPESYPPSWGYHRTVEAANPIANLTSGMGFDADDTPDADPDSFPPSWRI